MSEENGWIKNNGTQPEGLVDIKTSAPGFGEGIKLYEQDPKKWVWDPDLKGDIIITHYRKSTNIGEGK